MLAATGASLLLVALVSVTQAQGPGNGGPGGGGPGGGGPGGGGGRGGRGFGGGGPGGGGFGRGGGILGLLNYPAVQEDIALTADQKKKIDTVKEAVSKKRQALMPRRNNANGANGGANANAATGAANGGANANAKAATGNANGGGRANRGNRTGNNNANTNAVDANGNPIPSGVANGNGNGNGNGGAGFGGGGPGGGGPGGGRFQMTPEMQAAFQEMQEYSNAANANITTKILTKKQVTRLQQIDLQRQGPLAVLNDDIALKLNISEDVLAEMKGIQDQSRQSRREMFQAQRQNGPNFMTADGRFDRAAMQAYNNTDEGKAAQAKMQQTTKQMQNDTIAQIGKLLTKNQKAKFNAMQGKEFDLTKLTTDPNAPTPPASDTAKAAATTTKATTSTTKDQPKTSAKKKATSKRAATTTSNP